MKKSDKERLIKVISIWDEVQNQIRERDITKEDLLADTFLQWALTTPLYNIGEQVYQLSPELKKRIPMCRGVRLPVSATDWCTITKALTGRSSLILFLMKWMRQYRKCRISFKK